MSKSSQPAITDNSSFRKIHGSRQRQTDTNQLAHAPAVRRKQTIYRLDNLRQRRLGRLPEIESDRLIGQNARGKIRYPHMQMSFTYIRRRDEPGLIV